MRVQFRRRPTVANPLRRAVGACLAVALACAVPVAAQQGGSSQPAPAVFGESFPAGKFQNINPAAGVADVDLAADFGKRPVILYYWIPRNKRAEKVFGELQERVRQHGDKVALYGVVAVRGDKRAEEAGARAKEIGISVPLLRDDAFQIGGRLAIRTVPSINILDKGGRLRLGNGGSLKQVLEYNMTLADGIDRVAKTGEIGTYGALPRYDATQELIGKKSPDFKAASVSDGIVHRFSNLLHPRKVNVLIFWSVECPHCQVTLPKMAEWLGTNGDGINVVSAARVKNDATRARTREFTRMHGFPFTTLADEQREISEIFNVTATPTVFVIAPDGTIESVLDDGGHHFERDLEAKKKKLLPS